MSLCLYGKDFTPSHHVNSYNFNINNNTLGSKTIDLTSKFLDIALAMDTLSFAGSYGTLIGGMIGVMSLTTEVGYCSDSKDGIYFGSLDMTPSHYINSNAIKNSNFITAIVDTAGTSLDIVATVFLGIPIFITSMQLAAEATEITSDVIKFFLDYSNIIPLNTPIFTVSMALVVGTIAIVKLSSFLNNDSDITDDSINDAACSCKIIGIDNKAMQQDTDDLL